MTARCGSGRSISKIIRRLPDKGTLVSAHRTDERLGVLASRRRDGVSLQDDAWPYLAGSALAHVYNTEIHFSAMVG